MLGAIFTSIIFNTTDRIIYLRKMNVCDIFVYVMLYCSVYYFYKIIYKCVLLKNIKCIQVLFWKTFISIMSQKACYFQIKVQFHVF